MYLYKFTLTYKNETTEDIYKYCRYPKKTKLYQNCINLLNNDTLKRFTYSLNN